ncbi:MAG TPA: MarR family transcriptional regulator [Gemmatimonadaceae bacterium]
MTKTSQPRPRARLLDAIERGFADVGTAGVMLHQTVAARLGLHITDHRCMGLLCRYGPMTAGRLAELTGLTTGAITGVLNRLERHGWARRVRDPEDGRITVVEARNVDAFAERTEALLGSLRKRMRALASRYTAEEMELVIAFTDEAVAITRDETRKLQGEGEIE